MSAQIIPIRDNVQCKPSMDFIRGMALALTLKEKQGNNWWIMQGLDRAIREGFVNEAEAQTAYRMMGFKEELGE